MENRIKEYAQKSFLALVNPAKSVKKVFPNQLLEITEESGYYLGVKEVKSIPTSFVESLREAGYYQHTVDKGSLSGRGIDLDLTNPLTGRPMTGSSSGTALNVFLGINDIGIGTDGGGSVLAPAMSLNLYGFIHPDLGKSFQKEVEAKTSTDGISFSPSLGFMTKEWHLLVNLIEEVFPLVNQSRESPKIILDESRPKLKERLQTVTSDIQLVPLTSKYTASREVLIEELTNLLSSCDLFISEEGPVDVAGFGESIFGHFDQQTQAEQIKANKGFIRVVNMAGAIAITVPTGELAKGYVLICKNNLADLHKLLKVAACLECPLDPLVTSYFGELGKYFEMGI